MINYVSPVLMLEKIVPHLEKKNGSLININSLAGIYPNHKELKYCSTKFGMDGYIKGLQSNPDLKIRVTQYYLGATKTDMTKERDNYENLIDPTEFAHTLVNDLNNETFTTVSKIIKKKNEKRMDS
jgi:short-subunit dehydrogenase